MNLSDVSFGYVEVDGFSPITHPWIRELLNQLDGGDATKYARLDTAAELFFILRALPDDEFPGGKWATIQHLEGQIEKSVLDALERKA